MKCVICKAEQTQTGKATVTLERKRMTKGYPRKYVKIAGKNIWMMLPASD